MKNLKRKIISKLSSKNILNKKSANDKNPKSKENKIDSAHQEIFSRSKYQIIDKINNHEYSSLNVAIKTPNPKNDHRWGDYFFAKALKKSFEKKGFNVVVHDHEDWYNTSIKYDINLVLRGLNEYETNEDEINLIWNISHPELVTKEEYEKYDIAFISSLMYSDKLQNEIDTVVKPLLQCTSPDVFYPEYDESVESDVLFVGITRKVYRKIVKDVMETDFDVSVYGIGWEKFIDEKYIKGEFIPNEELHKYYSSCKILLNDHWDEMREMDFPSNRLFDALACGALIISDKIPSADSIFDGNVITYDGADDLNQKIDYYLNHEEERLKIANKGKEIVLKNHTFDNRVDFILSCLEDLKL